MVPRVLIEALSPSDGKALQRADQVAGRELSWVWARPAVSSYFPQVQASRKEVLGPKHVFCCCWFLLCLEMLGYGFPKQ